MDESLNTNSSTASGLWDRLGIFLSGLCAVHCLLVPVLLMTSPSLAAYWVHDEDPFHQLVFVAILSVALVAFVLGYRVHRSLGPVLWMLLGVGLILVATFFASNWWGDSWSYALSFVGGLTLMRAHFLNRAHCRSCEENHDCPAGPLSR